MMRTRSASTRGLMDMIRENPFLCVAFLSGLALGAIEADVGSKSMLEWLWNILGTGFRITADFLQALLPGLGGWLSVALTVAVGLIPYLLADLVWRYLRNR